MIVAGSILFTISLQGHKLHWTNFRFLPFTALYGLSPAIASFIVLKRNKEVSGIKEWLKNVFFVKTNILNYLLILFLLALQVLRNVILVGMPLVAPFYMFFFFLPFMLIGGGMEEAGWRYILQPQLEKKLGFIIAAVITGIIWAVWHLPFFFIPGTDQAGTDLFGFFLHCVFISFIYGAIVKIAEKAGVFLCVLFHTMNNVLNNALFFTNTTGFTWQLWVGSSVYYTFISILSLILVLIYKQKKRMPNDPLTKPGFY